MIQVEKRQKIARGLQVGVLFGLVLVLLGGCRPSGRSALVEGDRLLQAGKAKEAIPLLERAASDLQTVGAAWNHLGRAYHETGDIDNAR